jgi:hypothetical protein
VGALGIIEQWKTNFKAEVVQVFMEKVHSTPQMGVTSSFTFGEHFGFLQGLVV